MPNLNERLSPLSSVHHPGDEDKTVSQKVRKSKVTPGNAHVSSHLSLFRSLSLFITLFLLSRSRSVSFSGIARR